MKEHGIRTQGYGTDAYSRDGAPGASTPPSRRIDLAKPQQRGSFIEAIDPDPIASADVEGEFGRASHACEHVDLSA